MQAQVPNRLRNTRKVNRFSFRHGACNGRESQREGSVMLDLQLFLLGLTLLGLLVAFAWFCDRV